MSRRYIFILLLFCASMLSAQNPQGLISLKVYAPEKIIQGQKVEVKYVIETTNMSDIKLPDTDGGRLVDVDSSDELVDGKYYRRIVSCVFEVYCNGYFEITPLMFSVDGTEVRSDGIMIEASPNPDYGHEWAMARNYLYSLCGYTGKNLQYKYGYTTQYAFSDDDAKVFAIIVSEEYQPYIAEPLLAYGNGHSMWNGKDNAKDNSIYAIMSRYDSQLKYLKRNKELYRTLIPSSYEPNPDGVAPLLHGIEYGQSGPYNLYFPKERFAGKDSSCLVGCGPVALAQILSLHKSAVRPSGKNIISLKSGKEYLADLSDYPFSWQNMDRRDTASLMFASAVSVGADMSPTATSSSLRDFKSALICNWDYSPQVKLVKEHYDFANLALIYKELDEGRPVIVADDSHIFVCDGYYRDFLHYNLGWKGYCNGYYRAIVIPSAEERQLPFDELLIGVRPKDKAQRIQKTVGLKEPGTLEEKLPAGIRENITSLKICGPINGEDIKFIRQMAGAIYLNYYDEWIGSLTELDLSEAVIVGGGDYLIESADGYYMSGRAVINGVMTDYRYEFPEVSQRQWKEICAAGLAERESYSFRIGTDGRYYVVYHSREDMIGGSMFKGCHNLRHVVLPKYDVSSGDRVFYDCPSLETVRLNGAMGDIDDSDFNRSDRLEKIF